MRVLIQRVTQAQVTVAGQVVGAIERGYLLLVGVGQGDSTANADWLVQKISGLRIFPDANGQTNLSLQDVNGAVLVVSQFTLYADARKGRRPSFIGAAPPALATALVDYFAQQLAAQGIVVQTGQFGAMMQVSLVNDGPFTIWLEHPFSE
jgi:D-tyrosyl-tRNA(Tyr) deacylase